MLPLNVVICNIYNFLSGFKNLYGKFGPTQNGDLEYYLKLDGYYYCSRKKCLLGVIRVRNKRIKELVIIKEIIHDKEYLKELHPADACIIGLLANNERNERADIDCIGWRKMRRLKEATCFIKTKPILKIEKTYINEDDVEMLVLGSEFFDKEIEISAIDLCKNQALLYALDGLQAIGVGYRASELMLRNKITST